MQFKSKTNLWTTWPLVLTLLALSQAGVRGDDANFADDSISIETQEEEATANVIKDENGQELAYESPKYDVRQFYFIDNFDNLADSKRRWTKSEAVKDDTAEEIAKYDGVWEWESPQRIVWKKDIGLVLKSKAKHSAIAARLYKQFTFKEKPLVVQYEVTMQNGQECGGSYIKLLSAGPETQDLTKFNDKTPYTIMFGPDKCGNDQKLHFIFRHVNPLNGTLSEKHSRKPKDRLDEPFKDKLPHLYQLVVNPDNTFEVKIDHKIVNSGSLLSDFVPPVNPEREIDDPEDRKPEDWDEREKIPDPLSQKPDDWDEDAPPQIPDPDATKPADWLDDEPDMVPDSTAAKPDDWDTEIDGEWEAPLVDNPVCEKVSGCGNWKAPLITNKEYKGKWRAAMIENPNYQGKWAPRKIANPDFFEDLTPFKMTPISAIGIELWSMSDDILFDNMLITDDVDVANDFAARSFDIKRKYIDRESGTFWSRIVAYTNDNPWIWKAGIVLGGAFIVFLIYQLFSKAPKKEPSAADAKKTDAVQEDDPEPRREFEFSDGKKRFPAVRKSDLEVEDDEPPTLLGDGDHVPSSKAKLTDEEEEDSINEDDNDELIDSSLNRDDNEAIDKPTAAKASPRQRRVRKD